MPKQKIIDVYMFDELDDKAKEKARDWYRSVNDFDFEWDYIKDDAKAIGLKLTAWDYGRYAEGSFTQAPEQVANNILKEHGDICATYKTANQFLKEIRALEENPDELYKDEKDEWVNSYEFEQKAEPIRDEFLRILLEDYRINADTQLEYIQSDESIDESIECNAYEFDKEGNRI